jgi:hypothetical protein
MTKDIKETRRANQQGLGFNADVQGHLLKF